MIDHQGDDGGQGHFLLDLLLPQVDQIVTGDGQAAEAFAEEFVVGILDGHG